MNNVIKGIQVIFKEKFNMEIPEESFLNNTSLGVKGIGFGANYMFYFVDFVEKEFNIRFKREHFISGQMRTLTGICEAINELQSEIVEENTEPA